MNKPPNFDLTSFKNSYGIYVGFIAIIAFFLLRSSSSVNAGKTISSNPTQLSEMVSSWTEDVIPKDSLSTLVYYNYNLDDTLAPKILETYWSIYALSDSTTLTGLVLPQEISQLKDVAYEIWQVTIHDELVSYQFNPKFGKSRFVGEGQDSLLAIGSSLTKLLKRTSQLYEFDKVERQKDEFYAFAKLENQPIEFLIEGEFSVWNSAIVFELKSIKPKHINSISERPEEVKSIVIWFISSIVGMLLVLMVGYYRRGREGALDWKRVGIALITFWMMYLCWRMLIFLPKSQGFLAESTLAYFLGQLLNGLGLAIYMTLAYGVWESMNRIQDRSLQRIVDTIWAFRWFRKEVGLAIINIPLIGGILLLVFVGGLQLFEIRFFQSNITFVAPEFLSILPAFSLSISAIISTFLVGAISIGLTLNVVRDFNIPTKIAVVIATPIASLMLVVLPRFFTTEGSFFQDYLIFLGWVLVIYLFWIRFGGLSALLGISFFVTIVQVIPFVESSDLFYQLNGWSIVFGWVILFIFGIVAYKFAPNIGSNEEYSPEYEEKLLNQIRISNEIQIAAESQFDLMPHSTPSYPNAEIAGFFVPSFEVGGDFYDYLIGSNPDGTKDLCFTIADVSGKGMKAAMQAVYASGLINARLATDSPAETLRNVSSVLKDKTDRKTFVTAICAKFSADQNMLTFSNAGHCLPIHKRGDTVRFLESEGPRFALGIKKEVDYENRQLQVANEDIVLFYSDGLNEAANTEGERYDYKRVFDLLRTLDTNSLTATQIVKIIKDDVQEFSDYQMSDDTTLICLKITK